MFFDADSFHSAGNLEKLRGGIPLTDDDRRPWLEALRAAVGQWLEAGESVVLACSALKKEYRRFLRLDDAVLFVYLKGTYDLMSERLKKRGAHFMNPALLQSQFDALEEPAGEAVVIDAQGSADEVVRAIRNRLEI